MSTMLKTTEEVERNAHYVRLIECIVQAYLADCSGRKYDRMFLLLSKLLCTLIGKSVVYHYLPTHTNHVEIWLEEYMDESVIQISYDTSYILRFESNNWGDRKIQMNLNGTTYTVNIESEDYPF